MEEKKQFNQALAMMAFVIGSILILAAI